MASRVTIMVQLKILVTLFMFTSASYNSAILPAKYQAMIGHGFATKYFGSKKTIRNYDPKHPEDVFKAGYQNLRLRCSGSNHRSDNKTAFQPFLKELEKVVDDSLRNGLIPIISWADGEAEKRGNDDDRTEFVSWWRKVAKRLMHKDYRLSFDLFTELTKSSALYEDLQIYTTWTKKAVNAIRKTGGNNGERIVFLASPRKSEIGLPMIDPTIYANDSYMMVEWHKYAGGPNKKILSNGTRASKYWQGCGNDEQKQNLRDAMKGAANFTKHTGLLSYFAAWTPFPVRGAAEINNSEALCFSCFASELLKNYSIPWSLNVLTKYYDVKNSEWYTEPRENPKNTNVFIDMAGILDEIKRCGT